jgi:hypothetical protein
METNQIKFCSLISSQCKPEVIKKHYLHYVLIHKDDFLGFVELVPATDLNRYVVSDGLMNL